MYTTLTVVGLVTIALALRGLSAERPEAGAFGVVAVATTPALIPPATNSSALPRTTVSSDGPGRSRPRVTPGPGSSLPAQIHIPSLKVVAAIARVRSVDRQLTVPEDPQTVGWWPGAAQPGSRTGTVVLDGHVDSASRGPGAFFRLTELQAGDVVTVTTATGDDVTYQVTARRSYPKAKGLPADLFATTGPPRLVLITCSGQFDSAALSYRDNLVVFATPTR